ncbi:TonB-dependent siderophore receptor [Pigmentiphaga aceris]|uniref:TonB-dependent siderophore receptor n=1 Tax=Pigmentiphaga aceris TaxID=1940612 RepID=A0A5C0AYG2_9BURK|nr:TonB-dependent receptor [Pigmentiphaga aceris]QEI07482.1 TonB-dependent siderophore receptor [Pigmentiphaga aceris]
MRRHPLQPAPLALALALAVSALAAHAQGVGAFNDTPVTISLRTQPLAEALNDWARQTRIQLIVQQALVAGKTAPAVSGSFTPMQALDRLLAGTGLSASVEGSAVIVRAAGPQNTTLKTVTIIAEVERDATSEGTGSYAARAATITGMAQSLKDTPQSVAVVTRQRLSDQNLDRYDDVVMKTPGVSRIFLNSGQSGYSIRGFSLSAAALVDGLQTAGTFGGILGQAPDMATIDRVEVLRGAAGLQLGAGDPAGAVNMVRKRPLAEKQLELTARVGSWGYKRGELDATGPLNDAGTLRGRAVVAYEDRNYFYDRATSKTPLVYGVLEADIAPDTTVMGGVRHQRYDQTGVYVFAGLPVSRNGIDLNLPRSFSVGPAWSAYESGTDEVFAEIKHQFNADWKATFSVNTQEAKVHETNIVRGTRFTAGTSSMYANDSRYDFDRTSFDLNVQGRVTLLGRQHELRVGASSADETRDYEAATVTYPGQFFDLSDPHQTRLATPRFGARALVNRFTTINRGVYGNAVLHLADPLKLTLGGRVSWYESNFDNAAGVRLSASKQTREVTPFAGLVYALNPQWSAYASYSDIFQPQSSYMTASGSALDPALGSNYEMGVKGELFGGRMTTSAAIFQINQTGRYAVDPRYPTGGCPGLSTTGLCYVNGGKVRSRGLELEVAGELASGLQASASYTYTDAQYVRDRDAYGQPTAREGQAFAVVPRHIARAYVSYNLPGVANNWTVGGGVSAQSKTSGNDYDSILRQQPGRVVWDAQLRYRISQDTSLALNVNNVFDKRYYNDEYGYRYGEPRSAMLTLRSKF